MSIADKGSVKKAKEGVTITVGPGKKLKRAQEQDDNRKIHRRGGDTTKKGVITTAKAAGRATINKKETTGPGTFRKAVATIFAIEAAKKARRK
jgi:hypothetical protein